MGGMVIQSSRWAFLGASLNCASVSNALFTEVSCAYVSALYVVPAGGGAGPKSSSLLSESSEGGSAGRSSREAGGGAGPMTRAGLEAGGGAGPASLPEELELDLDLEAASGGSVGPATLRRFSLAAGLGARSSSPSRLRLEDCGGIAGPIEGMVGDCAGDVRNFRCLAAVVHRNPGALTLTQARAQAPIQGWCGPRLPISEQP